MQAYSVRVYGSTGLLGFVSETGICDPAHPNPRPTQTHWVKGGFWVSSGFHGWAWVGLGGPTKQNKNPTFDDAQ